MFRKPKKIFKKKKRNPYINETVRYIDYKDVELVSKFINIYGRIIPNYISGLKAFQQRLIAKAIKRARYMALIPYQLERIKK